MPNHDIPSVFGLKQNMTNYIYCIFLLVCITFGGCGGPEIYQMLIAANGNYGYFERNIYCHISNVNAVFLQCSQFTCVVFKVQQFQLRINVIELIGVLYT